jgi:DNA-directed RNA polymerase subunit beta'
MLSVYNMLLPSNGAPVTAPSLDMVLGCYYLTIPKPNAKGEGKAFSSADDAKLAYEAGVVQLGSEIKVRYDGQMLQTTVGRIIFNDALPPQMRFQNKTMNKSALRSLVSDCVRVLGHESTAAVLDNLKAMGFNYATKSGVSIAMSDIEEPPHKGEILREADQQVGVIEDQYSRGFITEDERYENVVQVWMQATDKILDDVSKSLDRYGPIYMMATSGAKGNISQIRQMAGMRGLMTDPSGKIIDFPIKASFREGLSPMEYFISTHGARKGLADTALRTSDSGYLTRRLVDVSQDVIVNEVDCGTTEGTWIAAAQSGGNLPPFSERMLGYMAASPVADPRTGEVICDRNQEIDEDRARRIVEAGIQKVYVRSPLNCRCRFGICQYCYGRDLATRGPANLGTAVGVIAAQSIGEPGTQLTLRTFHTGGVVGTDITTGLPRVEELFEARTPKGRSVLAGIDGIASVIDSEEGRIVKITNSTSFEEEYPVPEGVEVVVADGQVIEVGMLLYRPAAVEAGESQLPATLSDQDGVARVSGKARVETGVVRIVYEEKEEREYPIPAGARLTVQTGDTVQVGQQLTEGVINPHSILRIMGKEATQQYIIDEIQRVYCSQGVTIHDKHVATIVRQMLRRVEVISSGDTELLPGELVDRFDYEDVNARILAEGGEPATAQAILLGITRASLNKDSWLAAASFQETNRVLAAAALRGKIDKLRGLKENVILGKLIPSQEVSRVERPVEPPEQEEETTGLLAGA